MLSYQMAGTTLWYQVRRAQAGKDCINPLALGTIAWVQQFNYGVGVGDILEYVTEEHQKNRTPHGQLAFR
ncbi:MAG: hypothetical protein OHK0022_44250 [Roseiflexaceae bacterium]